MSPASRSLEPSRRSSRLESIWLAPSVSSEPVAAPEAYCSPALLKVGLLSGFTGSAVTVARGRTASVMSAE